MCVIAICYEKKLTEEIIDACRTTNSQGFGIAWEKDKMIHWKKGLYDLKEVKQIIDETPLPHTVHFRIATVGGVCDELCQPFPISDQVSLSKEGKCKKVLFHNGHVSSWEAMIVATAIKTGKPIPDGKWSDTRAIAYSLSQADKSMLAWVTGKYAVMEVGKTTLYWGEFTKDDGYLFSNKDWHRNCKSKSKSCYVGGKGSSYNNNTGNWSNRDYNSSRGYKSGRYDDTLNRWVYDEDVDLDEPMTEEEYEEMVCGGLYGNKVPILGQEGKKPLPLTGPTKEDLEKAHDDYKPDEVTEFDLQTMPEGEAPPNTEEYAKEYQLITLPDPIAKSFSVYMIHYPWVFNHEKGWVNIKDLAKGEMKMINSAIIRYRIEDQADYYSATTEEAKVL